MRILAGDIGGTKTALALYEHSAAGHRTLHSAVYASAQHTSLEQVLLRFFDGALPAIDVAGFGVAGPVQNGVCNTTNLPWQISASELSRLLSAPVGVVNDFYASALGVRELSAQDLIVLNPGEPDATDTYALIGAGTGLGEAIAVPLGAGRVHVLAGEGGHADFSPRNEVEVRLLRFLLQRHKRVSWERVVSGLGLGEVYDFVLADGIAAADDISSARFVSEAKAAVIGERGLSGEDPAAAAALGIFVSLYGAEAGNLALRVLPRGGLYIAGGMAHKLLPLLTGGTFMASFLAKGRMSKILEAIPVAIVKNEQVGLLGARAYAQLLSGR